MGEPAVQRPALLLLSTGGTIAGSGATSTQVNTYAAGALSGDALLAAVPELQQLATIRVEAIASVDSADLQFAHWRLLVARIREAFQTQPDLAGVVITHGTNTLEETAWLLQLLIDDPRPVVLVGAMRPATALSADGPLNLYQAVEVAIDPQARGRGVLAVLDGEIHGARAVTKVATQGVGAFRSTGAGPLGWVDDAGVHWPAAAGAPMVPFAALPLSSMWPQVAILHGCVEPPAALIPALLQAGVQGLVFTGTGAGQLSAVERTAIDQWNGPLPLMLRANRCGSGPVHRCADHARLGLLPAGTLSPQKARVLLLLALIAGYTRADLEGELQRLGLMAV
ncbi:asparaginase [Synechococcus sp. RS9916]|uniref:asparaginase n=1 Tax=Synechococcus sp. RS9916 TaxID=221359 RepID=UPI0000E5389C|nr:asparaginase [Synechococcus sp. RS9916]EAU75077.1 Asparaginase [Synechococcus sp. RS9916]